MDFPWNVFYDHRTGEVVHSMTTDCGFYELRPLDNSMTRKNYLYELLWCSEGIIPALFTKTEEMVPLGRGNYDEMRRKADMHYIMDKLVRDFT